MFEPISAGATSARFVSISHTPFKAIEGKDSEDFLSTDPKTGIKPVKTDLVNRYFNKVCLTSHTTYVLRHTNASILIYSELNIVEVANRLRNSVDVC